MAWAKMDDRRAMNRKLRAVGFEARGLDEAAIEQCVSDLSDGFVSCDTVETLAVAHHCKHWARLVSALVSVGRWEVVDGGWLIHDYLEFNPTREEWEAQQAKKREAGRRGGQAAAMARATAEATARAATVARARGKPGATPNGLAPAVANAQADPTRPENPPTTPTVYSRAAAGHPSEEEGDCG